MSLKKLCGRSGCNLIIDYGQTYCDKHQKEFDERQKQRHSEYKRQREDKREQAFYCSEAWMKTKDYVKTKYKGLCIWSYHIDNKIIFCDVVHHIVELKEDWELKLNEDNLIPLSKSIHQEVHSVMRQNKREEVQKILRELKEKWKGEINDNRI